MNPVISLPSSSSELIGTKTRQDTARRWRKLIERQRASGLSVSAFCREQGITASSLFAWRRRLTPGAFAEVKTIWGSTLEGKSSMREAKPFTLPAVDGDQDGAVELLVRGNRRLRVRAGFDPRLLLDVIRAVESIS